MAFNNEWTAIILKRLFENGIPDSDLTTLVAAVDNQKISMHRVILTAASKYFAAALGSNFQESAKTEFVLDGIDGSMLRAIVDFCYTGRIELTEANVSKYLEIASKRELDLLEQKCWLLLAEKLSVYNAAQIWVLADIYGNGDICQRAFRIVCESFEKFSIQEIQSFDHRLFAEILKSESLHAPEDLAFQRLMDWFRCDEKSRKKHTTALLKLVRLELISPQFLNDDQLNAAFRKFACFDLILAEYKRRSSCRGLSAGNRRRRSIFCLFLQMKGDAGAQHSAIKIERYNSASNEFEEVGEIAQGNRTYFGVSLHENKLYILGGSIDGVEQKSTSMFDLATGKEELLPEMNFARACFPSVVLGKHIYVFGGKNGSNLLNSCERFDMENKTWTILKSMNVARYYASAKVFDGYLYVAGGKISDDNREKVVEIYDPAGDDWLRVASMIGARSSFALFKSNQFLYAIGTVSDVERYNTPKNIWTKMNSISSSCFMTASMETDDGVFVVKNHGEFGKIDVDANGVCSFQLISKSKYDTTFLGRHFLYQN